MRIINSIAALITAALFIALMYTVPVAIFKTDAYNIRLALLNVFLLAWFTILFLGTVQKGGSLNAEQ